MAESGLLRRNAVAPLGRGRPASKRARERPQSAMAQPHTATAQAGAALTAEEARELIQEHARMIELERRERDRLGLVGKAQGAHVHASCPTICAGPPPCAAVPSVQHGQRPAMRAAASLLWRDCCLLARVASLGIHVRARAHAGKLEDNAWYPEKRRAAPARRSGVCVAGARERWCEGRWCACPRVVPEKHVNFPLRPRRRRMSCWQGTRRCRRPARSSSTPRE
mgnify:CR=1 FL=1